MEGSRNTDTALNETGAPGAGQPSQRARSTTFHVHPLGDPDTGAAINSTSMEHCLFVPSSSV
jgi:hypothetical protein